MLRAAVERQFEIIGEALRRLLSEDRETAERISQHKRIIAFRNILTHGAEVDDRIVWGIESARPPQRGRPPPEVSLGKPRGTDLDSKIRRYFELGCEVKGLGRGHIQRIKEDVRSHKA
jgi:hypothetical protein